MNRRESFFNFVRNHKKLIAVLSMFFLILITSIILIFTLFSLKSISLNFKTETENITEEVQTQIIDEVKKEGINTVLFVNKSKLIKRLEKHFPYIKIINIETKMPSTFVVHCVEREELYAIKSGNKTFYLDEDLKVLKIIENEYIVTETSPVLLSIADLELNLHNVEEGQFLKLNKFKTNEKEDILANYAQETLTSTLTSFQQNNRNIAFIRANYKKINIDFNFEMVENNAIWYVCLSLIDNNDFETIIIESNKDLSEKINIMIDVTNELASYQPERLLTDKLIVFKNQDGFFVYSLQNRD